MKKIAFSLLFLLLISTPVFSQDNLPDSTKKERAIMPVFPGGLDSLYVFLASNITFPEDAIKNNIEGKVLAQFILTENGEVEDVSIIESLYPSCDEEAIRVLKLMPAWTPAEYKGKKVKIIQKIPITFTH